MEKQTTSPGLGIEKERALFIDHWHTTFGIGEEFLGLNVYTMSDLQLLIDWWNCTVRYMASLVDGKSSKEKELANLQAALWIRINQLHPKYMLRFSDITFKSLANVGRR